ncbi:hypothetical protein BOX15_Mlig025026g2, partial [Macrostomum lignano]
HTPRAAKRTERSGSSGDDRDSGSERYCSAQDAPPIGAAAGQFERPAESRVVRRIHPRLRLGQRPRSPSPMHLRRSTPPERDPPAAPRRRASRRRRGQRHPPPPPVEVIDLTAEDSSPVVRRLQTAGPLERTRRADHLVAGPRRHHGPARATEASEAGPNPSGALAAPATASSTPTPDLHPWPTTTRISRVNFGLVPASPGRDSPTRLLPILRPGEAPTREVGIQTEEELPDTPSTYTWTDLAEELRGAFPMAPPNSPTGTAMAAAEQEPVLEDPIEAGAAFLAATFIAAAQRGEEPDLMEPTWARLRALDDQDRQEAVDRGAALAAAVLQNPEFPVILRSVARLAVRRISGRTPVLPEKLARSRNR